MTKPTIRDRIKEIVFRYFMPKVEAKAENPSDKVYEQFATALIQEELKSKEIETFIDELLALLSPQTGEGEYVDICRQNVEQSTAEEMDWEKEWKIGLDEIIEDMNCYVGQMSWEDAVFEKVHKFGKAFLRKQLDLQEKQIIDEAFEWIWKGWNLDLGNLDRAKEHFRSKLSSKK